MRDIFETERESEAFALEQVEQQQVEPIPSLQEPSEEDQFKELNARQAERERIREAFNEFWTVYPRKAGKQAALKAFEKAYTALGDFETIVLGAKRYRDDPNRHAAYTAHAATWLNAGRWDDEPLPERVKTKEEIAEEIKAKNEAQRLAALEESRRRLEES